MLIRGFSSPRNNLQLGLLWSNHANGKELRGVVLSNEDVARIDKAVSVFMILAAVSVVLNVLVFSVPGVLSRLVVSPLLLLACFFAAWWHSSSLLKREFGRRPNNRRGEIPRADAIARGQLAMLDYYFLMVPLHQIVVLTMLIATLPRMLRNESLVLICSLGFGVCGLLVLGMLYLGLLNVCRTVLARKAV
ncbi:hypothetical protein UAJ10_18540 [Nitrospirillum sp. BR 11164]|uniref:hypothetical protein n=1 Tax=Nitrospirillum sp. BR 11164 TaxID=3104324 RepID=UPI002B002D69|nr:hypothetical protein [Nitrospirillum sp. BR 11164]MEA1651009.1 hypothetical protein [Nitrospirillum sp. BR 11164]